MTHTGLLPENWTRDTERALAIQFSELSDPELQALEEHGLVTADKEATAIEERERREDRQALVESRRQEDVEQHRAAEQSGGTAGVSATMGDNRDALVAGAAVVGLAGLLYYGGGS